MILSGKPFDLIVIEDIERLIRANVLENRLLEYKQTLNIDLKEDKKEFLADVSAMANTDGGIIIVGIKEIKSEGRIELVGLEVQNFDLFIQKLEDVIRNGLQPKISFKTKLLELEKYKILLIGINKNWSIPSMISYNSTNKFYKRRDTGKYLLDVYELNNSFMLANDLTVKAENFKNIRIKDEVVPVSSSVIDPTFFLHIVPINSLSESLSFADQRITETIKKYIILPFNRFYNQRFNLDGLLFASREKGDNTYIQIFRDGSLELCTNKLFKEGDWGSNSKMIFEAHEFEKITIQTIKRSFNLLQHVNINPPYAIFITLINLQYCKINGGLYLSELIDKSRVDLPSIVIYDSSDNIAMKLKPIIDIIWQAGDFSESPNYNEEGWLYDKQIGLF